MTKLSGIDKHPKRTLCCAANIIPSTFLVPFFAVENWRPSYGSKSGPTESTSEASAGGWNAVIIFLFYAMPPTLNGRAKRGLIEDPALALALL